MSPPVSKAQFRLMEAKSTMKPSKARRSRGPSAEVAKEFVKDVRPGDYAKLPERVGK